MQNVGTISSKIDTLKSLLQDTNPKNNIFTQIQRDIFQGKIKGKIWEIVWMSSKHKRKKTIWVQNKLIKVSDNILTKQDV